jgi:hypothetical protein
MTGMNTSLRAGMDLIVRDLLQVGSGLPPGHVVTIANGAWSSRVKDSGTSRDELPDPVRRRGHRAVIPQAGRGPTINGVATDVLTVLMADNTFLNVGTTEIGADFIAIAPGVDLAAGADRVSAGQLMMVMKGGLSILLEVTGVDLETRRLIVRQRRRVEPESECGGQRHPGDPEQRRAGQLAGSHQRVAGADGDLLHRRHHRSEASAAGPPHQQRRPGRFRQRERHRGGARHREPAAHLRHQQRHQTTPATWR